jgi:four helix bundle protein
MRIERFEDLECWKEARTLNKMVYELIQNGTFRKDFRLRDQITGAAISVMNNIAEGFDSQLNSEFKRFLLYARRSVSEIQNCLYVALDQDYINHNEFETGYQQAQKTRQIIDGLLRYLRKLPKWPKQT